MGFNSWPNDWWTNCFMTWAAASLPPSELSWQVVTVVILDIIQLLHKKLSLLHFHNLLLQLVMVVLVLLKSAAVAKVPWPSQVPKLKIIGLYLFWTFKFTVSCWLFFFQNTVCVPAQYVSLFTYKEMKTIFIFHLNGERQNYNQKSRKNIMLYVINWFVCHLLDDKYLITK